MSWYPIAFLPPQIENASGAPYSGAVLKAYRAGTSTPIPMATDYTGASTAASMVLNASGYPTYNGTIVIPHLQENYKLALYPNQAAADANSGAIWNPDNIQIAPSSNTSFIQYFDGDGVTATFTLSQNFGTDENALMVFSDRAIPNYLNNGDFASGTGWTPGAGWSIGSGVATAAGAISTALTQNANTPLIQGQSYTVELTVTASAGTVTPSIGGNAGTTRGAGTFRETIIAGATQVIAFTGVGFTGTIDNVSVKPTYAAQRVINRPDEYTVVGNQLTLNNIPPSGTKNIIVFAPSQLLGAANNAAAAAATSEANALAYKNAALAAQVAAEAAYDSFDDRYLGAKAADPTLDNDGNALLVGALYFNTVANVMKAWTGAIWTVQYVPVTGALLAANNLGDVNNAAASRANLGAAASGANTDITSLTGTGVLSNVLLSKSGTYTIVNADKGKTITLGGSAFYTVSTNAVGGYDANFAVRVVNEDTLRAKRISLNGVTSFLLWAGQTIEVYIANGVWRASPANQRWMVTSTVTFYIDKTNGLDTNDGLATGAGNALLTIQKAVSLIRDCLDCQNINIPLIQLKSGDVQNEQVTAFGPLVDNVQFQINGDNSATPANWANYLWNVPAGRTAIQARDYGTVTVQGVKFVGLGAGATALSASQFGTIDFKWIDFGAFVNGTHMTAFKLGAINALGTYQISGNLTNHATAINNGCITLGPSTVTLPNVLTWPADFLLCNGGQINLAPITFSGAGSGAGSTGRKYQVAANGVLFLSGNTIPGATAGITATGGQVI